MDIASAFRTKKGEDCSSLRQVKVGAETLWFALVADGHGGVQAAEYTCDKLIDNVVEEAAGDCSKEDLAAAARRAYHRTHAEICALPGCTAGCTASLCIVNETREQLICVNVGDSFAMLVDQPASVDTVIHPMNSKFITTDHRINNNESERDRITAAGFKIDRAISAAGDVGGPLRAWPGGLAVQSPRLNF
eukprot:6187503-Pleurochrysis_carterae.AAC.2